MEIQIHKQGVLLSNYLLCGYGFHTYIYKKTHQHKKNEVSTGVDLNEDLEVNDIQKKLISSLAFSGR